MHLQPPFVQPAHNACEISQQKRITAITPAVRAQRAGECSTRSWLRRAHCEHRIVLVAGPLAGVFPESSGAADGGLAEDVLVRRVVADDPVAPEGSHRIDIKRKAFPPLRSSASRRREWDRTSASHIRGSRLRPRNARLWRGRCSFP